MKYSLLEMTQNILSAMDSDQVSSIFSTAESRQVAEIIRTAYFNIIARANLPEHNQLFQLNGLNASATPVVMNIPDNVAKIDWIKYNTMTADDDSVDSYTYVTILPLQQFLDMEHQLNEDDTIVDTMTYEGITHFFYNDRAPRYCTIIDDRHVIFDAYDSEVDTTLQKSKTIAYGRVVPLFSLTNVFVPDLDEQQFPLLLNEAKSLAFLELKQITHEKAEQESRRQWRNLQSTKKIDKPNPMDTFPNFGRC
jgi:hypothetical protein